MTNVSKNSLGLSAFMTKTVFPYSRKKNDYIIALI